MRKNAEAKIFSGKYNEQVVTNLVTTDAPFVALGPRAEAESQPLAAPQDMSSCLSIFVGRQSAGTATRAMPAREPAFIRKIVRAPRRERDTVHTHTRPPPRLALHKRRVCTPPRPRISASKTRRGKRSWRRVETYTARSRQRAAWSCPSWRAAGPAETCASHRPV